MRDARAGWMAALLAVTAVGLGGRAARAAEFDVPPGLAAEVDFWVDVFAKYGEHQIVIHDTARLDRIYTVLDFRDLAQAGLSDVQIELAMDREEEAEKARVRELLRRLDRLGPDAVLTPEEQRVHALFASDRSPRRFLEAASTDRVRGQRGLRERFARGIEVGHAYFPQMEAIFRAERVPAEITRLPLVESCFNVRAYSKVGAAGVWQFMPATARRFMRIDAAVDERLDPLVATRAAARFLRQNYELLGTWPLAIKAYNHGPGGIARAVRATGTTDVTTIIRQYRGPAFKFASRNFYPEFLAALHVERNATAYFGPLALHPPLTAEVVYLDRPATLSGAARCAGGETWQIADLNPGLLPAVQSGRRAIPAGYGLRLPAGTGDRVRQCIANLPARPVTVVARHEPAPRAAARRAGAERRAAKPVAHVVHRVRPGQTLSQIAKQYGRSVDEIRRRNQLKSTVIRPGQVLRIPVS